MTLPGARSCYLIQVERVLWFSELGSQELPGGCWGEGGRPGEDRMEGPRFLSASIRPITQVPPESLGSCRGAPTRRGDGQGASDPGVSLD